MDPTSSTTSSDNIRNMRSRSSDVEQEDLPKLQQKIKNIVMSQHMDSCMAVVIVFNVVIMILDTDRRSTCENDACNSLLSDVCNMAFTVIYTLEAALKIYALRCRFFFDPWNLMDFIIVLLGLADTIIIDLLQVELPNVQMVQMLRLFRLVRLSRIIRLLKAFPTLYFLVRGFAGAMEAIMWGWMLIVLLLVLWSLIAVELLHPVSKGLGYDEDEWCAVAFKSVVRATLYFMQTLIAGDSWGNCALPIMRAEPWSYFIFAGALVSVQLGFTNLILAIIVDKATQDRNPDNQDVIKAKKQKNLEFAMKMQEALKGVDEDESGTISLNEMIQGYEGDSYVRETLDLMDVDEEDIKTVFELLCTEGGGEVRHGTFVDLFKKAQLQDIRVYLMVMKLQVQYVTHMVEDLKQEICFSAARAKHTAAPRDSVLSDMVDKTRSDVDLFRRRRLGSTMSMTENNTAGRRLRLRSSTMSTGTCKESEPLPADFELERLEHRLQARLQALVHEAVSEAATLTRQAALSSAASESPRQPDFLWPKVWETTPEDDLPLPDNLPMSSAPSCETPREPGGRFEHEGSPEPAKVRRPPGDGSRDAGGKASCPAGLVTPPRSPPAASRKGRGSAPAFQVEDCACGTCSADLQTARV